MDLKFNLTNFAIISVMIVILTMIFAGILEGLKMLEGKGLMGGSSSTSAPSAPVQTAA